MAELTPQQILRNILSRRPVGSAAGVKKAEVDPIDTRDPRLDNFSASLNPYKTDLGGEISRDLTGYRIPIASDLGNFINAYQYGIQMNKYRDAIREELDAQLESEGIKKGSSEYWKEYLKRMPDVGSPDALVEFGIGATLGVPIAKGVKLGFGALKNLYNRIPKETQAKEQTKSDSAILQAELDVENLNN